MFLSSIHDIGDIINENENETKYREDHISLSSLCDTMKSNGNIHNQITLCFAFISTKKKRKKREEWEVRNQSDIQIGKSKRNERKRSDVFNCLPNEIIFM